MDRSLDMEAPQTLTADRNGRFYQVQNAPLLWLSAPIWLAEAVVPIFAGLSPATNVLIWGSAVVLMVLCWHFSRLSMEDQGDALRVWFGRVPVLRTRISYAEIRSFSADRTTWLDGWGLHYVRGGWLWNVWGFDCVRITTDRHTIRVGTNRVGDLLGWLEKCCPEAANAPVASDGTPEPA